MDKAVQFLQQELNGLRTGKANPALVENVTVDYYGTPTRLRDIANISTPEPRQIVINPFDHSACRNLLNDMQHTVLNYPAFSVRFQKAELLALLL